MPDTLSIALQSAASYRPPPPEGFEGGGIGTVPTGESWSLTAPYFLGSAEYPHIVVGYSAGLNNEYSDSGGGNSTYASFVVADDQSYLYYMSGYGPSWTLSKWSLTYPSDWSRTTFEGVQEFNFSGSMYNIEMYVDPSQSHLYILDFSAEAIHQYSLTSGPFTASYVRTYNIVSPYSGQPLSRPKYQLFSICMSGTKLILFSRQILRYLSYTLGTPYNIGTATPDWYGNLPFLSADGLGTSFTNSTVVISGVSDFKYKALQWSGDGYNLYLLGDSTYRILQFYCSDPWNLSSATLVGSISYSSQGSANDMFLNDTYGNFCIVLAHSNKITLWNFGSGLDISSLYFVRSWQPKYPNPSTTITVNAITFGDLYQWVYVLNGSRVIQYEIPGGISTLGINQYVFSVKTGLASGVSIQFNPNGSEFYIMSNSGTVYKSSVGNPWEINSAGSANIITSNRSLSRVCDVSGAIESTSDLGGFYIAPDGDKLFTCDQSNSYTFDGITRNMRVYRYNLSTSWNIASFSINSRSGTGYFSPNDTTPVKFKMSELGLRIISMYKSYNPDSTTIRILTLGSGGNLATAVYNTNNSTTRYTGYSTANFHFSNSGRLMYGLNASNTITKLTVSTAYSIANGFDITFQPLNRSTSKGPGFLRYATYNTFIRIKPDGRKLYVYRNSGSNPQSLGLVETPLDSAFDFNSRGVNDTFYTLGTNETSGGLFIRNDGTKFWIYRSTNRRIQEYSMNTAWNLSTSALVRTWNAPHSTGCGLHWTTNGQRLFMGTTDRILSVYCSVPWDISSGVYEDGVTFIAGNNVKDFYMDDSGTKMFICFEGASTNNSAVIKEYNMTNFDLSSVSLVRSYRLSNRLFGMITSATSVCVANNGQLMLMAYRNTNGFNDAVTDCLVYRLV